MPRDPSSQLTEVELQILQILWEQGPSPVRIIHKQLSELRDTNYSTTVKMLSVMLDKQLVRRNENERPYVYSAVVTRRKAQKSMLSDLIEKVYEGSATSLVMQALSSKQTSADDLKQIRKMIDELEGDKS